MNVKLTKPSELGFTLTELMIVVAIIGILASIAIPKFADMVAKSQEGSNLGKLGAVRSAISIYYAAMEGQYPGNLTSGLTTASNLIPALPTVTIPSVVPYGNPGHAPNNLEGQAGIGQSCPPSIMDLPDQVWYYFPYYPGASNIACAGNVIFHCTHQDTKGSLWSQY